MKLSKIFVVPFHVKRMEQSIMPSELSKAYVSCYAKGNDYAEVVEKSLKKLIADGLYPEEVLQPIFEMESEDWISHVREMWPDYAASLPTQSEFEDAILKGEVVYGPFGSYR
jgi:hypothetical protein